MSGAWPSAPTARPSRPDTAAAAAAAGWCCGTWPRGSASADDPLPVKEGSVESVAFSPDGKTLAAGYGVGGGGGGVVLWDVAARERLADDPLAREGGRMSRSVAFSPDGKTLAAGYGGGGGGGGVVLWDVAARQTPGDEPLAREGGLRPSVAFSPDGKTLAAGYGVGVGGGGGVVLWDVAARKRLADDPLARARGRRYRAWPSAPTARPSPPDTAALRRRRRCGAVGRGRAEAPGRRALPVKEGDVKSVAFSPDGKTLAAGYGVGVGGGVVLWDAAARERLADEPLPVKEGDVTSVAFSPDGKTLAAGYSHGVGGGGVVLWDVAARKRLARRAPPRERGLRLRAWPSAPTARPSPPDTAACGGGGGVVLWDVAARNAWRTSPSP